MPMPTHNLSSRIRLILVLSFGLVFFCLSSVQAQTSCHIYDASTGVPDGFGAAYNPLSLGQELMIRPICSGDTAEVDIGSGAKTQYIYQDIYVYRGGAWQTVAYTAKGGTAGEWLIGQAKVNLTLSSDEQNQGLYIVAYICNWNGKDWKCGCRDKNCLEHNWQLQKIKPDPTKICPDKDHDGYGDPGSNNCEHPQADCNDNNPNIHPGAKDICNNSIDENCDEKDAVCAQTCDDKDGDGYGVCPNCGTDQGCQYDGDDCDDLRWFMNPGAPETCDNYDNNCSGAVDEGCDNDSDGYCDAAIRVYNYPVAACPKTNLPDDSYGDDCDDTVTEVNPGEAEICHNNIDDNCDGQIDENCVCEVGETQVCGTDIGECHTGLRACLGNSWGECEGEIAPTTEICDGVDNNCNGQTDEGCNCINDATQECGTDIGACQKGTQTCVNGDWGTCMGEIKPKVEDCDNGLDDDCDGVINNGCDLSDPQVDNFSVSPNTIIAGAQITVSYSVSDDKALMRVELWRAPDAGGSPGSWSQVDQKAISGTSNTGTFTNNPPQGIFWYGLHAVDATGKWSSEGSLGPIKITVSPGTCSDGTAYNTCSKTALYCNSSGNLTADCNHCPCTGGWICTGGTTCVAPTVCTPDNCNNNCPDNCTASEDPDCASGGCCGDGTCDAGEDKISCPGDCACTPTKTCADYSGQCGIGLSNGCTDTLNCSTNCGSSEICCTGVCQAPVCQNNDDCDDSDSCTIDTCNNANTCAAACTRNLVTACVNDDGCCPSGCDSGNDNDCATICTENWICTVWSACVAGKQTRTCTDSNNCGTNINKPAESQFCLSAAITQPDNGYNYVQGDWVGFNVTAFGGTPPYTYQWHLDKQGNFSTDEWSSVDTTSWSTGSHTITVAVTDSAGQTSSDSIQINVNSVSTLIANIQMQQTEFVRDSTRPAIFGVDTQGGTSPYTFVWNSDKQGDFSTDQWPSIDVSSWPLGTHHITVTATDSANNSVTDTIDIEIVDISIDIGEGGGIKTTYEQMFDVWFNAFVNGGTAPYKFVWTSDLDGILHSKGPAADSWDNFQKDDLSLGVHTITVTVTDANNLSATKSYNIQILPTLPIVVDITSPVNNSTYQQGSDVNFAASVDGGVTPYTSYSWESNLDGIIKGEDNLKVSSFGTSLSFIKNNLSVGNHIITLTVSDNKGNSHNSSINITISHPAPIIAVIDSPINGNSFKRIDEFIDFSASATGGVTPYTYNWSSNLDGNISTGAHIAKNNLSVGNHIITLTATDNVGASQSDSVNITVNANCAVNNIKDNSKYTAKNTFLISDENWREVLALVPLTTWNDGNTIHKYPSLIFHKEGNNFDADSSVHFMQMYEPDNLTTIGAIPANLNNLLTAASPTGAGLNAGNIANINSSDYFSYWSSYNSLVIVDYNNYKAGLMASVLAVDKNSPIIFVNSANLATYQAIINGKTIYTVGALDSATQSYINNNAGCQANYTLEEAQKWYAMETNSDKLILVNPNDLNIEVNSSFTPEKSSSISHLFSKTSLAAPFLAAVKQEVISFTELSDSGANSGCSASPVISANIVQADADVAWAIENLFLVKPKFLTIVASPRVIPDSEYESCYGSWQFRDLKDWRYGSIADNKIELSSGRIFGVTSADASSYIMTAINYDYLRDKVYGSFWSSLSIAHTFNYKMYQAKTIKDNLSASGYDSYCYTGEAIENCTTGKRPPYSMYKMKNYITFGDHGSPYSWSGTLDSSQIPWLDLSFSVGDACLNNDYWQYSNRNFGAHMIRRGAIGFIGAIGLSYGTVVTEYGIKQLGTDINTTLGEVYDLPSCSKKYFNLLGDPTLQPKFKPIAW